MTVLDRSTHDVLNQAPPIAPYNVFEADLPLREALEREGGGLGRRPPARHRRAGGQREALEHSERCERNEPVLRTHDRYGNRIDEVELDPSWHWLLREAIEREIHSLPWRPAPEGTNGGAAPGTRAGGHTVRAALMYVWSQVNAGVMCPVSMTYSVIPALRENPDLAAEWEPRLTLGRLRGRRAGRHGDDREAGRLRRARQHHPRRAAVRRHYEITGHKWFCSYPPCDVFLTLAQAPAGLSCFLIEGADPGFQVQRLKDKLGTRSLPSSEVEFRGVRGAARRRGGPRRADDHPDGQPHPARLPDRLGRRRCAGAPSRPSTTPATGRRSASTLAEQPAMQNVLADLAIESEAATATAMRIARAYDEDDGAVPALRHRGVEVLGLQARAPARRRGARVPGRQRLRGGVGHAAALPRLPAQLDLGGLGQRGGARRAARDGQGARGPAGLPRRGRAGGRRQRAPGRPRGAAQGLGGGARLRRDRPAVRRAPTVEDTGPGAPGLAAGAQRSRRGLGRLLRLAARRQGGRASARCRPASTRTAIVDRALPA